MEMPIKEEELEEEKVEEFVKKKQEEGKLYNITEISEELGIHYSSVVRRINENENLVKKPKGKAKYIKYKGEEDG